MYAAGAVKLAACRDGRGRVAERNDSALGTEQEVDRLAGAVDGPVEVAPLPADPDVGLVDVPRAAARPQMPAHTPLEVGREALDPAVERDVVQIGRASCRERV